MEWGGLCRELGLTPPTHRSVEIEEVDTPREKRLSSGSKLRDAVLRCRVA
jgi:hypothetical protein